MASFSLRRLGVCVLVVSLAAVMGLAYRDFPPPIPPAPASGPAGEEFTVVRVHEGETLETLSGDHYGHKQYAAALRAYNLSNPPQEAAVKEDRFAVGTIYIPDLSYLKRAYGRLITKEDTNDGEVKKPATATPPLTAPRTQLTLAGAELILGASKAKAQAMKLRVNVAVVDDGGHPLAFARMDEARPGSAYTALTKAVTAATMRAPTGPLPAGAKNPDILLNLSLQNAAAAGGGKLTTLHGGVPVEVEKQVIGAVGVGGATGEQDAEVARAGIAALLAALKKGK